MKRKENFEFASTFIGLTSEVTELLRKEAVKIAKEYKINVHTCEQIYENQSNVFTAYFSGKRSDRVATAVGVLTMQKDEIVGALNDRRKAAEKVGA